MGSLANLVGSWIAYGVGYFGRVDIIEKHGHKVLIKQHHLDWADRWFERYGDATVFFTRMLPIIRTFISLPAGIARMPFWRFTVFTLLGCIPWVFMLTFIGKEAGDNWEDWKDSLHYVDYAVAATIVIGIVYLLIRRAGAVNRPRNRPDRSQGGPDGARPGPDRAAAGFELRATSCCSARATRRSRCSLHAGHGRRPADRAARAARCGR